MMKNVIIGINLAVIASLSLPAFAGVIRHDRNDSQYQALAADSRYASVGDMLISTSGGSSRCSGTNIGGGYVLTAAHCVDNVTGSVSFTVGGSTFNADATNLTVHENWTGNLTTGWDIALVDFGSSLSGSGVATANLWTGGSVLGQVGTNVGFGTTGDGLSGYADGTSGTKRAGNNMIDFDGSSIGWSDRILFQDFDNPLNTNDSFSGSNSPLELEYLIAPGDSGGGMFIDIGGSTYLTGVHSFIASVDGVTDADYGDLGGSTNVTAFLDWIDTNTATQVPEPNSIVLLGLGLAGIGLSRLRKA